MVAALFGLLPERATPQAIGTLATFAPREEVMPDKEFPADDLCCYYGCTADGTNPLIVGSSVGGWAAKFCDAHLEDMEAEWGDNQKLNLRRRQAEEGEDA